MAHKKNGITASTPAIANNVVNFKGIVDSSGPSSIEESSLVIRSEISDDLFLKTNILPSKKLTTLELLYKAIEVVGVPKKGASYIAIQKWIINNKEDVVIGRLKANLKKTVIKALENGILKRARVSQNATGLLGYFMLNTDSLTKQIKSKTSTKKTVAKKENKDVIERESVSDTEVTKKPRKRNAGRLNKSLTDDEGRKKVESKSKANILGVKVIPKVGKVKAASDLASKANNAMAPKEKNSKAIKKNNEPPPKEKNAKTSKEKNAKASKANNAPARRAKPIVASTSEPESETVSNPEPEVASTSEEEFEIASNLKPKVAKMSKKKAKDPISKSKSKAVVAEEILEETEPISKPKLAKSKAKEIADEVALEEPSMMMDEKLVTEKSKKQVGMKLIKNNLPRTKKLFTSRMNPEANMSRKDLSDTELTVKPDNRKSMKSYSSDTEIDVVKKGKATRAAESKLKIVNTKKLATVVSEAGPSKSKVTKKQKAKNAN